MWNLNARFRPKELTAVPNFTLEIFTTGANECLTKKLKENKKLIQISPELEITGRMSKNYFSLSSYKWSKFTIIKYNSNKLSDLRFDFDCASK